MKEFLINNKSTIKSALKKLVKNGVGCLVVINKRNKVLGTLTDGDLRRAILEDSNINRGINKVFNLDPTFLLSGKYKEEDVTKIFNKERFSLLPVVDDSKELIEVLNWSDYFSDSNKKEVVSMNIPVVIMAGGKGTRLEPFTHVLPKPLIPLGDKTVIESILDSFNESGFKKYFLSVNYKGTLMKAFFEELNPTYSVKFIEESKPLGTAGSLSKLRGKIKSTFLVTNCDVIIKVDHKDLLEFHKKNKCDITLVASTKDIVIPYGACEIDNDGFLKRIIEKPSLDYLINAGLYVLEPHVLDTIPKNTFFHITDLIDQLKKKKRRVGVFPIDNDSWIDIGQWEEYRNAIKRFN